MATTSSDLFIYLQVRKNFSPDDSLHFKTTVAVVTQMRAHNIYRAGNWSEPVEIAIALSGIVNPSYAKPLLPAR